MGASVSDLGWPAWAASAGASADLARALWREGLAGIQRGGVLNVELTSQQLGPREVQELCQALASTGSVKALELDGNRIGDEGAERLAERLADDSSINFLDLGSNGIRDAGATALAVHLGGNCALRHLDLTSNRIKGHGGLALGRMLGANSGLRQLTLSENKVGAECARAIGQALPSNLSLRILNLRKCGLGPEGARLIAQGLSSKHAALAELSVGMNKVRDDGAAEFAKMLSTNRSIQELYVDDNRIGNLGGTLLAEALMGNHCLQTLWMVRNQLDGDTVSKFTQTVRENPTLRRLGITVRASVPNTSLEALDKACEIRRNVRPAGGPLPPLRAGSRQEKLVAENIFKAPISVPDTRQGSQGIPDRHSHISDTSSDDDSQFAMVDELDVQQDIAEAQRVPRTARASRHGVSRQIMSEHAVRQIVMLDDALQIDELQMASVHSTACIAPMGFANTSLDKTDVVAPTELPEDDGN
jgi:Ran GTPase-activating protein (RanGAP) involved in mRNA processing and transport